VDLYKQLEVIHAQCRVRKFSNRETMDVMRLCIYACLERFPPRPHNLPSRNHVLTSIRETVIAEQ
jgi:hypothetical protein